MSAASHDLAKMAAALGWRPCGEGEVFTFYMNADGLWCLMSQYVGPPPEWATVEWDRRPGARRADPFRKLNHFTFGLDVIDEIVYASALRCAVEWIAKAAPHTARPQDERQPSPPPPPSPHRPQVRTATGLQRRQDGVTRRRHLDLDRGFARADRILAGMEDRGLSRVVYSDGRRGHHIPEQDV